MGAGDDSLPPPGQFIHPGIAPGGLGTIHPPNWAFFSTGQDAPETRRLGARNEQCCRGAHHRGGGVQVLHRKRTVETGLRQPQLGALDDTAILRGAMSMPATNATNIDTANKTAMTDEELRAEGK